MNAAQDPLSHVASWLTPQSDDSKSGITDGSPPPADPVDALAREWNAIEEAMPAADQAQLVQLADRTEEVEAKISKLVASKPGRRPLPSASA
jgi:hypothetical protein